MSVEREGGVRLANPQESFRELVERELPRLYGLARMLAGADAEDAVQECLLKAYRGFAALERPEAAAAWLTSILVNCCHDIGRARSRRVETVSLDDEDEFSLFRKVADEDPFPYSDSLHLDFLQQFGRDDVRAVLMGLPPLYRTPLVLAYVQGYYAKEVAFMLGVPLGTVLARLHRGRKLFERRLWEYAEAHGLLKEDAAP
jgi:RNA polymerase sigma-70 factor (ECF subfamily)